METLSSALIIKQSCERKHNIRRVNWFFCHFQSQSINNYGELFFTIVQSTGCRRERTFIP